MACCPPPGVANESAPCWSISAHQIEYSRNAPQATAHAAVDATRILGQARASGLVNAVLRRFVARRRISRPGRPKAPGRTAILNGWWLSSSLARVLRKHPGANNEHRRRAARGPCAQEQADYIEELKAAEVTGTLLTGLPLRAADRPVAIALLPDFVEGMVSVRTQGHSWRRSF